MSKKYYILLFILCFALQLNATDLKVGSLIKPRIQEYTNNPFNVEFEVDNINVLTADAFTATIIILNSLNQALFQEIIEASNLPANSSTTLKTETQFTPLDIGDYKISIEIDFSEDIDNSNNQKEFSFEAIEMTGSKIAPGMGVNISQIDFTFTDNERLNSSTGLFYTNFEAIFEATQITNGFISAYSPTLGWFIQNMIYDYTSTYSGLSGMFNLMSSGGDITSIEACAILTEEPLIEFVEPLDLDDFVVTDLEYNAQGRNAPIGNILAPIPFSNIPFTEGGKNDLVWQHDHVNLEQDLNQCGPGALANSLQWLENEKGINVPHEHKKGIRDSSLVGQIDQAAQRTAHQPVSDANMLNGKLKYIDDNNITNSLSIKHKNRNGQSFVNNDTVKVGNTKSIAHTDTSVSLIDWIIAELKHGEDVELGIGWNGGGGHWVDLIGGGYVNGVPWLAWVHDTKQGYDNMGTATTADDTTKANGGLNPASGGYGWSYIINNQLAAQFGTDTSRGTIDLAFSESKDTTSVTSVSERNINNLPRDYSLEQNYPNPFNPTTKIRYTIPERSVVKIKVFDILGNLVRTLSSGYKEAGSYEIEFTAGKLASGIYLYTIEAGSFTESKKMILLK